ncbi:MAG: hypothetical protein JXR83_16390 [Deltaproteobacteria bacterium]|nr:hypothetical protein [Deltaproteobacteria bacterium]
MKSNTSVAAVFVASLLIQVVASSGCDCGSNGHDGGQDASTPCAPAGVESPEADVQPTGFGLYTSISLPSPSTSNAPAHTKNPLVRIGLTPDEPASFFQPAELGVFVNGCPIDKSSGPGEDYFWQSSGDQVPVAPQAGRYLSLEVRHGAEVLARLSRQLPANLPNLTSPASGASTATPPIPLAWDVLGLANLAGATSTELRITAWVVGSTARTDGSQALDDATGSYSWFVAGPDWTHLELSARMVWDLGFGVQFYYMIPVNG